MRIAVAVATMALASNAWAAGFDCKKASSPVEKLICSDSQLSAMDEELSQAYKRMLATAADAVSIKNDQKVWLASRNRCQDAACIKQAYADRLTALNGTSQPVAANNVTGTYQLVDCTRPAQLQVQQNKDGSIHFELHAEYIIDAKNGIVNDGNVYGDVPLKGSHATYINNDPSERCNLSLRFEPRLASIAQEGTCGMGMNVVANGKYKLVDSKPPSRFASIPLSTDSPECRQADLPSSPDEIRRRAEQGDANAQYELAQEYERAKPTNYEQAAIWFRKAADQGLAAAQYQLGLMYGRGLGLPEDYDQAMAWFKKASDQGLVEARDDYQLRDPLIFS